GGVGDLAKKNEWGFVGEIKGSWLTEEQKVNILESIEGGKEKGISIGQLCAMWRINRRRVGLWHGSMLEIDLFMHTTTVGRIIEEIMEVGFKPYFSEYCDRKAKVRHAWILNALYLGTAALMLIVLLYGIFVGFPSLTE
ncbi:MAG: hypothetical protein ABIA59_03800, partial [Candidatus Latescibacterota bacterium]